VVGSRASGLENTPFPSWSCQAVSLPGEAWQPQQGSLPVGRGGHRPRSLSRPHARKSTR
jgi:hypothetical protein